MHAAEMLLINFWTPFRCTTDDLILFDVIKLNEWTRSDDKLGKNADQVCVTDTEKLEQVFCVSETVYRVPCSVSLPSGFHFEKGKSNIRKKEWDWKIAVTLSVWSEWAHLYTENIYVYYRKYILHRAAIDAPNTIYLCGFYPPWMNKRYGFLAEQ